MLMVIDTETTGLTAGKHEIVQISCLAITEDFEKISYFTSNIKPRRVMIASDDAMKVNQLKFSDLESAPTSEQVRANFLEWREDLGIFDQVLPVGWNYMFDEKFLRAFFGDIEYDTLFEYWALDVKSMAFQRHKSRDLSLEKIAEQYDIPHKPHDAMGDVYATFKLLKEFLK